MSFCSVLGSWFRLLSYKKEIMVCNDTGLIVRYIPFSPVRWVEIWGLRPNTEYTRLVIRYLTRKGNHGVITTREGEATPRATPPAILFQISKIFNFSNNLPQATPPASPQAIFEKNLPLGHAFGNLKKTFASWLRLRLFFKKTFAFKLYRKLCLRQF
ncbi:hypothetical protein T01_9964 [Trichinella spiralis]|uniref:Uncharacterized protein n=1 Tax=Trichinella spiralis TaxID=6334 RepID=A0A0V1BFQ6_TRISP|nr:hypothetical protein T01_9964 [Trichinella spiralis]